VSSRKKLISTCQDVFASGELWMILGGGSNIVVSDDGFDGHVIHIATKGKKLAIQPDDEALLTVQAGEQWDDLVAYTVTEGLQGIESLSGIPGTVGASVIQNIGAYGYELSDVLDSIELLDFPSAEVRSVPASDLQLGHRTSALKTGEIRGVVLSVTLRLTKSASAKPIAYTQVSEALDLELGAVVPLSLLRKTVLQLRRSKGMVIDAGDVESRSCGSFFMNPVVSERFSYSLPTDAPRYLQQSTDVTVVPLGDEAPSDSDFGAQETAEPTVKLSAAWLIENSGIPKGFQLSGNSARVSTKHTLAITNPGGASAENIASLARYIQTQVLNRFGVVLQPEPVLVGLETD
jgi:UDP-N-acetylmuramate dehydrogenase